MIKILMDGQPSAALHYVDECGGLIDLYNCSVWPKSTNTLRDFVWRCKASINEAMAPGGCMVFWVPLRVLHTTTFHPSHVCEAQPYESEGAIAHLRDPWTRAGSILTANEIGFIYRKPHVSESAKANFGCRKFFQEQSAQKSSVIAKHLVEQFCAEESVIFDQMAHRTGHLAIWAKRSGVNYIGYSKDEEDYDELQKKLAQVELPMIQESLFDDQSANRHQ